MNGKRWPWEAVALLPFIDSAKLIQASRSLIDESELTDEEKRLNAFGETYVLTRSPVQDGVAKTEPIDKTVWAKADENVAFQPMLNSSTNTPGKSFPTLRDAPIKKLSRRKVFLNIFGLRSRYRTICRHCRQRHCWPKNSSGPPSTSDTQSSMKDSSVLWPMVRQYIVEMRNRASILQTLEQSGHF